MINKKYIPYHKYLIDNWLTKSYEEMATHIGVSADALKKAVTEIRASGVKIPIRPCGFTQINKKPRIKPVSAATLPENSKKASETQKPKINGKRGKSEDGENWAKIINQPKEVYIAEKDRPQKIRIQIKHGFAIECYRHEIEAKKIKYGLAI